MMMRKIIIFITFCTLITGETVFGQCTTDPNFIISHPLPNIGQPVAVMYNGMIPFEATWDYTIDFGDGQTNTGSGIPANGILGIVSYTGTGTYTIQVNIEDTQNNCTNSLTQVVTVVQNIGDCEPAQLGPYISNICLEDPITFNLTLAYPNDFPLDYVEWDLGDGNIITTTTPNLTYQYAFAGIYYVTAKVVVFDGIPCTRYALSTTDDGNTGTIEVGHRIVRVYDGAPTFTMTPAFPITNDIVTFTYTGSPFLYPPTYLNAWEWNFFFDNTLVNNNIGNLTTGLNLYTTGPITAGPHSAELGVLWKDGLDICPQKTEIFFTVNDTPCDTCNSFKPIPGKRYWMSAWVHEDFPNQVQSFDDVSISFDFFSGTTTTAIYTPTGEIIDGWQRIVGEFTIPVGTYDLGVNLNAGQNITYFDDIRIHPFNSSMKSYVYDGETFWLVSELDDNNYATFYEYDEEGGLVRIKKETSRGIVTIQETRSNTIKQ